VISRGQCVHLSMELGAVMECALGHSPRRLAGRESFGWMLRAPCRTDDFVGTRRMGAQRGQCADYVEPTQEQIAQDEHDRAGICLRCGRSET